MMFTAAVVLTPGQTIAIFERNVLQHCWVQHCARLTTLLRRVAPCWILKIKLVCMSGRNIVVQTWPNDYYIMQHPQLLHEKFDHFQIWADNTQHVATRRNRVAKCAQHAATNNDEICYVEARMVLYIFHFAFWLEGKCIYLPFYWFGGDLLSTLTRCTVVTIYWW